jgi:flagellum-specific peptidoglycan hydrolase FlgJ
MKKLLVVLLLCCLIYGNKSQTIKQETSSILFETDNKVIAKFVTSKEKKQINHPFIEFCEKYQEIAIFHHLEYGIPVSIQFAQAIAESGGGKSDLAILANNLFGMKYYKELYLGDYFQSESGVKWRKYNSFEESFEDHALFLKKFYPHAVGKPWKYWIENCKGYGGIDYWQHIGKIIEMYELYNYDDEIKKTLKNKTYQI